jgi:hypothetical protein
MTIGFTACDDCTSAPAPEKIGFFEELAGERSMTRLIAFLLGLGCLVLVAAIVGVALRGGEHAAGIIAAVAAALTGLGAAVFGALKARNAAADAE